MEEGKIDLQKQKIELLKLDQEVKTKENLQEGIQEKMQQKLRKAERLQRKKNQTTTTNKNNLSIDVGGGVRSSSAIEKVKS